MPESLLPDDPRVRSVMAALEDPRFKWRTVQGLATTTKLSTEEVLAAIATLISGDIGIRSTIPAADGRDLYTTRAHFKSYTPLAQRLAAAFRNRAD